MKNLDCEVLDDNTRKYDLKDITPYFEKDREIKFRAIDENNKIYDVVAVDPYLITAKCEVKGMKGSYWCKFKHIIRYTGIKDKNGEEVYEGDIITQHKLRSESMGEVNYEVVWIDQWCAFAIATLSENKKEMIIQTMYSIYTNIEQDFEVIGNKYTNKNLIK